MEFLLGNYSISAIQEKLFEVARKKRAYCHADSDIVGIMKLFLENGASVTAMDPGSRQTALLMALNNTHIHYASDRKNGMEIVKVLMGDDNLDMSTLEGALHLAAQRGNLGVLKLLLERGMDVNATNSISQTPLHLVNGENVALFLVHMGADIYTLCHNGSIAMSAVCCNGEEGGDVRQTMILAEMSRTMNTGLEKLNKLVG